MSRSHEEPLRSNNFQKVTPRRVKSARCFSSLHLFLSSSSKVDLIYPELCLLLDKTHTGKHAEASENTPAELVGLSFTVTIIVW